MRNQPGLNLSKGGMQELKRRLLFLIMGLMVYRFGVHIPVPGLDPSRVADLFQQHQDNIIGMFNMFTGGALETMAIFALGIMPYISASIIMQLFTAVSPHLEQLKKEGEAGRRKINQYTRYGTLVLALFQAVGMCKFLVAQNVALHTDFSFYFTGTISLVTGTMFLMWLGEQITERGVGNGISMIIFAGIVSGLPSALVRTFEQAKEGQLQGFTVILIVAIVLAVTAFVVFIEQGQRRITINYAKRQQGRKMVGGQTTHLPLKINISGVIPPIFASSIILFPATLAQLFAGNEKLGWMQDIAVMLAPGQGQPLYMLLLTLAIVFFAFFYTAIVFNPRDTADNLKKSGAFIPGIRPGLQTAIYIDSVMSKLTLFGAMYLVGVVLMPEIMHILWNVPFYFGGTSLLIIVVVVLDFITQVQALMMSHQYESLLKKANLRGNKGADDLSNGAKSGLF